MINNRGHLWMTRKMKRFNAPAGCVYLVGAGIGPIAYLTLQAHRIISRAEVLIYDALVDPGLLTLVPSHCLLQSVGKRGGLPSTPQGEINQLLVSYGLAGKQVVRLKGGDPFIFGRANPEIQALQSANCPFQVIPGLSSAIAAPLLAGIPLTDKDLGQAFVVLTGHEPESLDWNALARIDTLVILMGGQTLPQIVQKLLAQGRCPQTPVAIIKNAGYRHQQFWIGNLTDIVEKTANLSLSPAVIAIGSIINLRTMSTSPSLPLLGKTILVTRAAEQASQFTDLLREKGGTVLEMPTLTIQAPSDWQPLDQALQNLRQFQWLILTSANGVNFFFERSQYWGQDSRALQGIKIAVVGQKTASVLANYGLKADFIPPDFVADALVAHFPDLLAQQTILFPRVETGGREVLVKELSQQGAKVVEVPAYQSACPETMPAPIWQAMLEHQIDILTFASSKTVQNFNHLVQQQLKSHPEQDFQRLLANVCIASIGPQTSKTCLSCFGRVDVEAKEYTLPGLVTAILDWEMGG
jgi:uroporphyrinogen III methyltransferase/synthase